MFWRTVVCDSDESTKTTDGGPWQRVAQMAAETFEKLTTGASWSGHERNHLFMGGLEGHQFMRVSGLSGLDDPGDSRAFATLDFDRDGWLDVVLGNISAPRLRLFRNELGERPGASANGHVAIRFVGGNREPKGTTEWSSRDGLGALAVLDLGDGRRIHREHRIDDGFKAQNSATMLIGIGTAEDVVSLRVRWPSGREQVSGRLARGSLVTVYEDVAESPDGTAFVSEPYRLERAREASATRGDGWRTRMFPAEPSGQTLRLPSAADSAEPSTLVLYVGMATWCTNCANELPLLRALDGAFDPSELRIVGVPCDPADTAEKLRGWARRLSPPYEILTGISDPEREAVLGVADALLSRSDALPFSIVTDTDGEVLLATWGPPSRSDLERLLWIEDARANR